MIGGTIALVLYLTASATQMSVNDGEEVTIPVAPSGVTVPACRNRLRLRDSAERGECV